MLPHDEQQLERINSKEQTREQIAELAFSEAELEELARAREMPITFDADCLETTPARAL